ncbi:MAG: hypothetical protein GX616_08485 [Planctomycetes bacterium]|nr:hypothetical protein [Planctomycetota bacterium]
MRRDRVSDRFAWVVMFSAGCWLLQGGCMGFVQRELEVLVAAEANGVLIRSSYLYDLLGPALIAFSGQWF